MKISTNFTIFDPASTVKTPEELKTYANGNWVSILSQVAQIDPQLLDGGHHPCPKCGGKDRFRLVDKSDGAVLCNQCFDSKNGDGFSAIQWMLGCTFPESLEMVANSLGLEYKTKTKKDPAEHLDFVSWNQNLANLWCSKKPGIKAKSLELVDARMAIYRKGSRVIALPVTRSTAIVGWVIFRVDGQEIKMEDGQPGLKIKSTAGSEHGIIGKIDPNSTEVWKTEGPTDLLALLSLDLPSRVSAFTNANGSNENPNKFHWLEPQLVSKQVYVIHDADMPGQEGATFSIRHDGSTRLGWAPSLSEMSGKVSKNVLLPYSIEKTKGKDIRDWIIEGGTYEDLKKLPAQDMPAKDVDVDLADDDPERLAKINLDDYKQKFGGDLRYYCDEWWKYQDGCWKKISDSELRLKTRKKIVSVFRSDWLEYRKRGDERAGKPARKVTDQIIANVMSAMKHMAYFTSDVEMPCWMPDRSKRNYISMKNGILDLDLLFSGSEDYLLPHSPHWFSSFQLDYDFDPDCPTPKFEKWLNFTCRDEPQKAMLLQEFAGYLFQQNCDEQCFLVAEGPGQTGKTTYFNIITSIIGEKNISNLSLEQFADKFSLSSTIGKVANICGDIGKLTGEEEGVLKRYTGNERIQVDRKNLPHISFQPTAKLMFAWNDRPHIKDKSTGFWRRLLLVSFKRVIPQEDRIKKMSTIEYWNDERPGIFAWAIVGLKRLIDQDKFTVPPTMKAAMEEYRDESNPIRKYFSDYIESVEDGLIETGELYSHYKKWCEEEGYQKMSHVNFGKELKNFFPDISKEQRRDKIGKRFWVYKKIEWSENCKQINF